MYYINTHFNSKKWAKIQPRIHFSLVYSLHTFLKLKNGYIFFHSVFSQLGPAVRLPFLIIYI